MNLAVMQRRARDSATRLGRAVATVKHEYQHARIPEHEWLAGYVAENLLSAILMNAEDLTDVLNEEDSLEEDLERLARVVYTKLRARRLARLLGHTEGRTAAEAAEFLRKRNELQGG